MRYGISTWAALLLLLFACYVLPQSVSPASAQTGDVIRAIEVEGAQRIEPNTVRSYLLVQEGDSFDPGRIDRSLKSLFATGLFADVAINRVGNALVVKIVENPVINRIAFEGNSRIDDETLEAETTLRPRVIYTRTKVQSDVRRILALYRRSGRFSATVDPKVIQLPQNRVDVAFEIHEGSVTEVESIRFVGNKEFDDSELRGVIRTKETAWWRFLSSDDTYDPDRLTLDRELLRRFYLSEGYADFRVDSAVAELTPDRKNFFITFTVEEGERYEFGTVAIETTLPGLDTEKLKSEIDIDSGDWYDADSVETTIDFLSDQVGNLGYAFVEVRPRLGRDRENLAIDVTFEIDEGPRVFVERIDITGNVRTRDYVIRREFRLVEGDAFNAARLRRSRQRIQDLDFFEKVEVQELPGSAPDKTVIKVEVEEKSTGQLSFGAGFSSASGALLDVSLRERNLLGRGQDLRLGTVLGQRTLQIDLGFTEPYFLGRDIAAGFDIFHTEVNRQSESSFDSTNTGLALRAGYPITEHLRQSWRYTLKQTKVEDVDDDASIFVKSQEGEETVSEATHRLVYDKRDSRINTTKGYYGSVVTDIAGLGGTVNYVRNTLSVGYYYPIADEWILSLTGSGGHIFGFGGEDVRLIDRFFVGGDDLRGFATDGIGPRDLDSDDALGGENFYTGTIELNFPLGLPEELAIRGRVFTDFGSLWDLTPKNDLVADDSSLRASVGVGLTWVSPFGPIGIDLGQAVLKEDYDDTEIFRVNFGTRF